MLLPLSQLVSSRRPPRSAVVVLELTATTSICLISIIRLKYLVDLINYPPLDYFYNMAPIGYWTMVETNGAIVCACLMTLKPFVVRVFPRVFGSSGSPWTVRSGSDKWVSPPTIGSKDPLSASKLPRHMREISLEELREGDMSYDGALELEEAAGREDATTSSLTGADEVVSPTSTKEDSLSPPPVAHLKAPGQRQPSAFYDSASASDGDVSGEFVKSKVG